MSNSAVGNVYALVIEQTCAMGVNDFEENGVPQEVLQQLKEAWQQRLSGFRVAQFPWDPPPMASVAAQHTAVMAPIPKQEDDAPGPSLSFMPTPNPGQHVGVKIKQEPTYEGYPNTNGYGHSSAQLRAASLLQQQYGQQASASLQQGGFALPGQQRPPAIQLPGQQATPQRPPLPQQFSPQQQQPSQQQAQQPRAPLHAVQTDGAGDDVEVWNANVAARAARSNADREVADREIRAQMDEMTLRMEGGIMMPLSERTKPSRKRKARPAAGPSSLKPSELSSLSTIPQFDGKEEPDIKYEDDEKDEDAINSDLDDSEDELTAPDAEDDEAAAISEAILCTYDKVQRVKNKWKCTLKDGVLATQTKDYVFHKAQGEFEW